MQTAGEHEKATQKDRWAKTQFSEAALGHSGCSELYAYILSGTPAPFHAGMMIIML